MLYHTPYVLVPRNSLGRDFVIGDLHGCLHMLQPLLLAVNFDTAVDRLFSTGDLIHRGPHSLECLLLAEAPWFHAVRGNHEAMQLVAWRGHHDLSRSIRTMAEAHEGELALGKVDTKRLGTIIDGLPLAIEIPLRNGSSAGIVHAGLHHPRGWLAVQEMTKLEPNLDYPLGSGLQRDLLWERDGAYAAAALQSHSPEQIRAELDVRRRAAFHRATRPLHGIDLLVAGHTSMPSKHPLRAGKRLYLDSGAGYNNGPLSLLNLNTGAYWTSPDPSAFPDPLVSEHFSVPAVDTDIAWLTADERQQLGIKD